MIITFEHWLNKIFGISSANYYNLGSDDQEEIYGRYIEYLKEKGLV